jgi:hypothetical protein
MEIKRARGTTVQTQRRVAGVQEHKTDRAHQPEEPKAHNNLHYSLCTQI